LRWDGEARRQAVRSGAVVAPVDVSKLSGDQAEVVRRYPPRWVATAFQAYIQTAEWEARALTARNKVWWPSWYRIRDMWGDVSPDSITLEHMQAWRATIERNHGRARVATRTKVR
jgi:hypothetical protein